MNENRFHEKIYREYYRNMLNGGEILCSDTIKEKINSIPNANPVDYITILCLIMNSVNINI